MIRYTDLVEDTICAQITPPGFGGVSDQAFLAKLKDPVDAKVIDEALITFFAQGKSFTGDSSVEISLHGSPNIVRTFLEALKSLGCRQAEKGEFSFRAFFNGRLDLTQAEAIHSLIGSETKSQAEEALGHLSGRFRDELLAIENNILEVLTQIEAAIDFSERDIVTEASSIYLKKIAKIFHDVELKRNYFKRSKNLVSQKRIIIAGSPNVGKSSLFNCLVNSDRAIVSSTPGTTRDLVHEEMVFGDASIKIQDSAGLRETKDPIEKIGIGKSYESISQSDLILWVNDVNSSPVVVPNELKNKKVILIQNKIDKLDKEQVPTEWVGAKAMEFEDICWVSATSMLGIDGLKNTLAQWLSSNPLSENDCGLNNSRQYTLLLSISDEISQALEKAKSDEEMDLCAFHLKEALDSIQNILGKQFNDEILDNIFSGFCLGK